VAHQCTVLIAAPELIPALKARTAVDDALRALDVITQRRPTTVALERAFAATPRGAALINRIKADPALSQSEIRVVSHDSGYVRIAATHDPSPAVAAVADAPREGPDTLDEDGTRGTRRVTIAAGVEVLIDGNPATLIDLSIGGAQVLSATALKPNQRVRVAFADERGTVRLSATVAWASFEIPPRYRAGVQFLGGDPDAIEAFALRHRAI
jgi:hypothetical protein